MWEYIKKIEPGTRIHFLLLEMVRGRVFSGTTWGGWEGCQEEKNGSSLDFVLGEQTKGWSWKITAKTWSSLISAYFIFHFGSPPVRKAHSPMPSTPLLLG